MTLATNFLRFLGKTIIFKGMFCLLGYSRANANDHGGGGRNDDY